MGNRIQSWLQTVCLESANKETRELVYRMSWFVKHSEAKDHFGNGKENRFA